MKSWRTLEEARKFLRQGTGAGIKVALLDSGIELTHPQLKGLKLIDDIAIIEQDFSISAAAGGGRDVFGHGTAIAGILRQIAPEAEIGSFRVLGEHSRSRSLMIREGVRQVIEPGSMAWRTPWRTIRGP